MLLHLDLATGKVLDRHAAGATDLLGQFHRTNGFRVDQQVDPEVELVVDHRVVAVSLVVDPRDSVLRAEPLCQ